jgi:hypothetical protein
MSSQNFAFEVRKCDRARPVVGVGLEDGREIEQAAGHAGLAAVAIDLQIAARRQAGRMRTGVDLEVEGVVFGIDEELCQVERVGDGFGGVRRDDFRVGIEQTGRVVDAVDGNRDRRCVAVYGTVVRFVGEAVGTVEVGIRLVSKGAIRVQRQRAV